MTAMLLFFTFGRIAKERLVFGNADGDGTFSILFFAFPHGGEVGRIMVAPPHAEAGWLL